MIKIGIGLDLEGLDAYCDELEKKLLLALHNTSEFALSTAQEKAPVDSGYLRASLFHVGPFWNTYGDAKTSSLACLRKGQSAEFMPFPTGWYLASPEVDPRFQALVGAGAPYAMPVEIGSFHVRGNTQRIGNRAGRIGVRLKEGVIATYTPGYYFMHDTAKENLIFLDQQTRFAIRSAGRLYSRRQGVARRKAAAAVAA